MSLLHDIKESFESRSYLDEESMEDQNFNDTVEDDCTNQADVEQSEYSDRKAEEEYEKEQEAVRSTIELLENNLEDIKSLSPAYTESAKEVVNAQLADASQALSLGSGFGQLELDDTGRVSMESYLEVRKALAKARKVYSQLSMEGFLDFFRGKKFSSSKDPLEVLKENISKGVSRTESIKGSDIYYIASNNLNAGTLAKEVENRIKLMSDLLDMYTQIAPVSISNIKETVDSLKTGKDRSDEMNASKLKAFNSKVVSRVNSTGKSLQGIEFDVKGKDTFGQYPASIHYDFDFDKTAEARFSNSTVQPMSLAQAGKTVKDVEDIRRAVDELEGKLRTLSKTYPFEYSNGNLQKQILSKYSISPQEYDKIEWIVEYHTDWVNDLHRAILEAVKHVKVVTGDLIKYAILSTQ